MISRRSFLGCAGGALGASLLSGSALAKTDCIIGAIRWDAPWYGGNYKPALDQLGPKRWQYRAPWFAHPQSDFEIVMPAPTQANFDLEITAANAAGLHFWAYDWPVNRDGTWNEPYLKAWNLHQSSLIRNKMNWCLLLGWSTTFTQNIPIFVSYMKQPNYQKVLGNRPVLFFFTLPRKWASEIAALRVDCITSGLGTPYIVAMNWTASKTAADAAASGADAISTYAIANYGSYDSMLSRAQASWSNYVGNGFDVVPNMTMGWDTRDQAPNSSKDTDIGNRGGLRNFTAPGTVAQRVTMIRNGVGFIGANPTSCPAKLGIIYAWNECSEGGGALIPTLGDPPASSPPHLNKILTGVAGILN